MWWHPSASSTRVPGTLSYSPKSGIILKTHGILLTHARIFEWSDDEREVLCGKSDDGVGITLGRIAPLLQKGYTYSEFRAQYIFWGHAFSSWTNIQFQELSAQFPNVEEWMCRNPFGDDLGDHSYTQPLIGSVTYRIPDSICIDLNDDKCTRINMAPKFVQRGPFHGRLSLELQDTINISTKTSQSFDFFYDFVTKFSLLLSFVFKHTNTPLQIDGRMENEWGKEIVVICAPYDAKPRRRDARWRPLFTIEDVDEDFPSFLRRWLTVADKYRTVLNLLLSGNAKKQFLEARYLQLIQGIEVLDRLHANRRYVEDEKSFTEFKKAIILSFPLNAPENLRNRVRDQLNWANQLSLRHQLYAHVMELASGTKALVLQDKDTKLFVDEVIGFRNYFTHYGNAPKKSDWVRDVLFLCPKLEIIIAHGLLRAADFNDALIDRLLKTGY